MRPAAVAAAAIPANEQISTTSGSATIVYQVALSAGVLTVSPVDITTSTGLTQLMNALSVGAKVQVAGVPLATGNLRAYTLRYFTGDLPTL